MEIEQKERKKIGIVTFFLAINLFLNGLLGILRDRILVSRFSTAILDTYSAAFRLPDFVYSILILGALGSVFIPIFTRWITQNKKEEAFLFANSVINLSLIILIPFCLLLIIFTPYVLKIIIPGFDTQRYQNTIILTRILLFSPIFFGMSGIFGSMLNSFKEFIIYSFSPIAYNLGIIFGILFLSDFWGIYGTAWGAVIGSFLHFLIPFLASFKYGYRYKPVINFNHEGIKTMKQMIGFRVFDILTTQMTWYFYTFLGSFLRPGSIAILDLTNHIQNFPLLIFSSTFTNAIFPYLSEKVALGEKEKFLQDINWAIRQLLFLILPVSVAFIVLRAQIVRLILGSQIFTWEDTQLAAAMLLVFALSLPAQSLYLPLYRAFYAILDAKTPTKIGIVTSLINIIIAFVLVQPFFLSYYQALFNIKGDVRALGLVIAFAVAVYFNTFILFLYFHKRLGGINFEKIISSFLKISFASILMGFLMYQSLYFIAPLVNMRKFWGILIQTLGATLVGFLIYITSCWFLKIEEKDFVKNIFSNRFVFLKKFKLSQLLK